MEKGEQRQNFAVLCLTARQQCLYFSQLATIFTRVHTGAQKV